GSARVGRSRDRFRHPCGLAAGPGESLAGRGACGCVAPTELRGRGERAPTLRLGARADQLPAAEARHAGVVHASKCTGPIRGGLLRLRWSTGHDLGRIGASGRHAMGDRGVLRVGQGRLRGGRGWGAELDRLAPTCDAQSVRPGRGGRDPLPRPQAAATEKGGPRLIRLSVPEMRNLLLKLVWDRLAPAEQTLAWSDWRRAHQYRARYYHYQKH